MDTPALPSIETIIDDFAFLDEWEDRYRYLIELGRQLPPLADEAHNDANRVQGCASQVWLQKSLREGKDGRRLDFEGDSDALIVRGLVAIVIALFSGRTPAEILSTDAEAVFARLGLKDHLSQQRSNGLRSMVARIRAEAAAAA
ncbi:SufE family protein [Kaistia geumhonensis]|uniref:Cysteine desulfuration protein SufE n=1 Tax=Kaistia geumhonensis TaxID=410839 RepID=A0ABU0M3R0_9HYPH|nr:SufE family protein [Kaistia geumhonensis]MCX5479190.1 SufE family protein [Kaistia geumhonensis]MDQ0515590.1 cysteine desulfuration protein SufE [Kaistia geumhonensis]